MTLVQLETFKAEFDECPWSQGWLRFEPPFWGHVGFWVQQWVSCCKWGQMRHVGMLMIDQGERKAAVGHQRIQVEGEWV
jgi:hypothetical protein